MTDTDPLVKALEPTVLADMAMVAAKDMDGIGCERGSYLHEQMMRAVESVLRQLSEPEALTTYKPGLTAICPRCSAYIVGEGTGPSSDQSVREECARIAEQEAARLRDKQDRVAEYDCDTRLALHIMEQRALTAAAIAAAIRAADTAGKEIHSSDGGVEGHAAGRPESASNSVEQADAVNAPNIRPAGIKPGPSEASPPADVKGLVEAVKHACDLLTERVQGSHARSPAHNARVVLESALSRLSAPGGEG